MNPVKPIGIPANKMICNDALRKVSAINIVKDGIDEIGGLLSNITNPFSELFTMNERNKIEGAFVDFYGSVKDVLDKKSIDFMDKLNDCIKRELLGKKEQIDIFT